MSLFYPTLLVIVTVIQLQVFHKKYLETLKMPSVRQSIILDDNPPSSICYDYLPSEISNTEQNENKHQHVGINISNSKMKKVR